jgi:hypothetical protein
VKRSCSRACCISRSTKGAFWMMQHAIQEEDQRALDRDMWTLARRILHHDGIVPFEGIQSTISIHGAQFQNFFERVIYSCDQTSPPKSACI